MENRPFQVDGAEERINKDVDTRQPLTENVLACLDLEFSILRGSLESCF